jgi:succinate dehydrogenase / fumarate reductase, membrane anchor subunit
MIRAKRYEDARAQAKSNPELAWWVFMRVSGLVLVFLVLGHIYMTLIQQSDIASGEPDTILEKLSQPVWKLYDWLILLLAGLHGLNGARYSLEDYIPDKKKRFLAKTSLYTVAGVLFIWGTIGLLSFQAPKL